MAAVDCVFPILEKLGEILDRESSAATMASCSFVILSPTSTATASVVQKKEHLGSFLALQKSSFLQDPKLTVAAASPILKRKPTSDSVTRCCYRVPQPKSLDHIPKQFREENLKDGLMDNYKNMPQYLYGLTPSQMEMFMTEDNPVRRQAEKVTEDSISSAYNYINNGGMYSLSDTGDGAPSKCSMSASMYRGAGGYGRRRSPPPDLPSLILDARVVYLGMPIVPEVTELLVAQFMYLDYDNPSKPIYLYINSPGTQNEQREIVGSETDAYAIADSMGYCKSGVYTVNIGMAFGQAAMLLALGKKGYRALQPNCSTKLYLPEVHRSSGASTDMWIKAKELDANTEYYLELLAKGSRKPKEEIAKDIRIGKYFRPQQAIDYGIADRIMYSLDGTYDKRKSEEMRLQSLARRRAAGAGPQAAPSGLR